MNCRIYWSSLVCQRQASASGHSVVFATMTTRTLRLVNGIPSDDHVTYYHCWQCMCLHCSHTVHMGHECFLSTAAADMKMSMTHSSAVSDGATDDGIVHNGCQHTQSLPSSSIWQITAKQAEYILTYKPDGTFLVWERSGTPFSDPSSTSINTHVISVV